MTDGERLDDKCVAADSQMDAELIILFHKHPGSFYTKASSLTGLTVPEILRREEWYRKLPHSGPYRSNVRTMARNLNMIRSL